MIATRRNMQALVASRGEKIAVPGVFSYSEITGERCSASPGDYFMLELDEPLLDSEGFPMILASETKTVRAVKLS